MRTRYDPQVIAAAMKVLEKVLDESGQPFPFLRAELGAARLSLPMITDNDVLFYLAHYQPDLVLDANWFGQRTVYGRWPFSDKRQHVRIEKMAPEYPPQVFLYGDRWARIRKDYLTNSGPRTSWAVAYTSLTTRQRLRDWLRDTPMVLTEDQDG